MAQPGNFTPILLYGSSTPTNVPLAANLTNSATGSEIAINVADKNLFFKDSGGVVNTVPIRQSSASSNGWLSSTDWSTFNSKAPATSGTSILYGNGSGGLSNVTIGSGISFAGGTLSATGSGGTVTSVAALTLGTTGTDLSSTVANGTTTPVITLNVPTASAANRGALSAADWSTFNGKQAALVSGTNIKTVGGVTLLGSGDVGTIGVGYGGTGLTSLTANYIPYGNGTSAFSSSSTLTYNGTALTAGNFVPGSSTVPTNGMYLPAANAVGIATNSTNRIYITSGGLVGFNTSTPSEALTIQNGGYPLVGFYDGATARGVIGYVFDWGYFAVQSQSTLGFRGASTEYGRFDSSGNFLIGTTSNFSAEKICVLFNGATNNGLGLKDSADASGAFFQIFRNGSNTIIGSITRVGTTNAILYNTTSDYRLKTVISPVSDSGTRIDAVEPIEYDFKDGGRTRGFLAHKFAEVYPNSVSGEKDAVDKDGNPIYQGMQASTPEVMADLIAEIQSLRKRVALLESR